MNVPSVHDPRSADDRPRAAFAVLLGLMLGVLAWGALLALGSYLHGHGRAGLRAVTILGTTVVFVGFWSLVLWWRQRRTADFPRAPKSPS